MEGPALIGLRVDDLAVEDPATRPDGQSEEDDDVACCGQRVGPVHVGHPSPNTMRATTRTV
jgi:hypothetical protein